MLLLLSRVLEWADEYVSEELVSSHLWVFQQLVLWKNLEQDGQGRGLALAVKSF